MEEVLKALEEIKKELQDIRSILEPDLKYLSKTNTFDSVDIKTCTCGMEYLKGDNYCSRCRKKLS